MKKWLLAGWLSTGCVFGNQPLDLYFSYLKKLDKSNGKYEQGEIQVVVDSESIAQVSKIQETRLLQKGFSESDAKQYSRIGVIEEDQYLIWIRDAVYFPKKIPGTYDRIVWKNELSGKSPGVAVLPILASGRILLNLNYRHATRSWELEVPRGGMLPNETYKEAALREVKEETGAVASDLVFLGDMAPDTGILSSVIPVFLGKVSSQGQAAPEESEAIANSLAFTKEELQEGLRSGFMKVLLHGKEEVVPIRDGFLTFALFQAGLRGLL